MVKNVVERILDRDAYRKKVCERAGGRYIPIDLGDFVCRAENFYYGRVAGKFIFRLGPISAEYPWREVDTYGSDDHVTIASDLFRISVFNDSVYLKYKDSIVRYEISGSE